MSLTLTRRNLNTEDIKCIEEVFKQSDASQKGFLTRQDLKVAVLNLFGYKPTKYELDQFMKLSNENELSLEKFQQIMETKLSLEDEDQDVRHMFHMFDIHCQGFLTAEDFKNAFKMAAPGISEERVCESFRSIDQDGDGRISFAEFEKVMKPKIKKVNNEI